MTTDQLNQVDRYFNSVEKSFDRDTGILSEMPINSKLMLQGIALAADDKKLYETISFSLIGTDF